MKMRIVTALGAGLLIMGMSTDLAAQGRGRGKQGQAQMRFQGMDTDRDGVITRAEWRGNARSFEVHDWNGDGVLSGNEVRVGARPERRSDDRNERDLDSPWDDRQIDDWTIDHYQWLDRNRDGRVTSSEWVYARDTFRRIDHNNDGWVSQGEFLGSDDVDDDAEDLFMYLDDNGDGRLTREEWHGTAARFDALDRNRDGVVTRAEASGTEAPGDLFDTIDANNDRLISRDEWRWSASSFDSRDANRDGRLSRDEFVGLTSDRSTAYRTGYERGLMEGRAAGREDRERNQGWDLEGQRELEQADSGYQGSMGPRDQYQAGYREGFRRGYREGWDG